MDAHLKIKNDPKVAKNAEGTYRQKVAIDRVHCFFQFKISLQKQEYVHGVQAYLQPQIACCRRIRSSIGQIQDLRCALTLYNAPIE